MLKDYLKIQNEQEEFSFGINFGYVDRVAGMFDFEKNKPQNLTAYNLSLDIENADKIALQDLDKIINSENKSTEAIIFLDGIISKGKAKIAKVFSLDGISYDVEIIN